ncbi:MAG: glycosyltransferase family 9 protein [Alcaligenaceae bacterium]|nr:glycosyltransferase family 9 protein [Alcaligenaceae bacterium]
MSPSSSWSGLRKILCIRLDNLGDVLMTTPAIRALKQACPGRRIALLASPAGAALAPFLPDVDEVIAYDAPWVKNEVDDPDGEARMLRALRAADFDAAVIFTVYSQSPLPAALMCRLAGIPRVLAHCRENPYRLLSDWQPETEPHQQTRHETRRQLDLVERVGAVCKDPRLVFATRDGDRLGVRAKLRAHGLAPGGAWIVSHCGATAPSRRYPPECFAEALSMLGGRAGTVVLTGGASEQALTDGIRRMCAGAVPIIDFAGLLSLGELACLIEDAALLLSNNSGPVHLAAALGTPVVDLYALTNPQHTPWMVPSRVLFHDVPCKYCYRSVCPEGHHDCLRKVPPATVCAAVLELLAASAPNASEPPGLSELENTAC